MKGPETCTYSYTPGPWMIFPGGNIGSASVRRPDTTVIEAGAVKGRTIGEAMNNARLIASAPELLEACQFALDMLDGWPLGIGDIFRNAIQKATGQPAPRTISSAPPRPTIVCLCGSTRFSGAFQEANLRETLEGRIVLSIGCDTKSDQGLGLEPKDKERLDLLHLRKIDLADEVLILNVGGYIGESTRRELEYARQHGKLVRFLEGDELLESKPAEQSLTEF